MIRICGNRDYYSKQRKKINIMHKKDILFHFVYFPHYACIYGNTNIVYIHNLIFSNNPNGSFYLQLHLSIFLFFLYMHKDWIQKIAYVTLGLTFVLGAKRPLQTTLCIRVSVCVYVSYAACQTMSERLSPPRASLVTLRS